MPKWFSGYAIENEDRGWLKSNLTRMSSAYKSYSVPDLVDPWKLDEKLMPTEDQGQIGSCFPAGTLVTMANGSQLPIEDIKYGMQVLSHTRRVRDVVDTMRRKYTGDMYTVHVKGWRPLTMTADHVVPIKREGREEWVKACEIRNDDLMLLSAGIDQSHSRLIDILDYVSDVLPMEEDDRVWHKNCCISMPRYIELDELAAWCIGLYVAEGSSDFSPSGYHHRSTWTLHTEESEYAEKLRKWADRLGLVSSVAYRGGSKAMNVRITCAMLSSFLSNACGRLCNKKCIPTFVLSASPEVKLAFLRGYYDGDGACGKHEGAKKSNGALATSFQVCASTASRTLSLQISALAISLGMKPGRTTVSKRGHQNYDSNQVYLYSDDARLLYPDMPTGIRPTRRQLDNEGKGQWRKIRSITAEAVVDLDVFDITVGVDHSFVAEGVAVHNCQGQSLTECAEYSMHVATNQIVQFSRMFAYLGSQKYDGINGDQGSTLSGGTKLAGKDGLCLESTMPYPRSYPSGGARSIPQAAWEEAKKYLLKGAIDIEDEGSVRQFIGGGAGIVQIGIAWGDFMEPRGGFIRGFNPSGNFGGHAVVFCGYAPDSVVGEKSSKGYWYILKNSWSQRWGVKGRAWVDPSAVAAMLRHKFTVMVGRSDMESPRPRPLPVDWTKPGNSMIA